jgi:hypothetical protein
VALGSGGEPEEVLAEPLPEWATGEEVLVALARPTTRVLDLLNAVAWWTPLAHPADRPRQLADADVPARVRLMADAHGATAGQRAQLVPLALRRARDDTLGMRAAARADPVFRWWDEGLREALPRAERWLTEEEGRLAAALR